VPLSIQNNASVAFKKDSLMRNDLPEGNYYMSHMSDPQLNLTIFQYHSVVSIKTSKSQPAFTTCISIQVFLTYPFCLTYIHYPGLRQKIAPLAANIFSTNMAVENKFRRL
jgi:hypothetical protein